MSESNNPFPRLPPPPESRANPFGAPPAAQLGVYNEALYGVGPSAPGGSGGPPKVSGLAVAGFVLGLSSIVLFITGIVPILAIVFGLLGAGTVKRSAGTRTGLKMARAGWILGVLGLAAFIAVIVVAIVNEANDSESALDDLEIGACYDLPIASEIQTVSSLEQVPCAEPHRGELFYQYTMNADHDRDYPGEDATFAEAGSFCTAEPWADYVGLDYDQSIYEIYLIIPAELNWKSGGEASCFVVDASDSMLTGSVQNAGE